jgi:hypothetical protein
MRHPNPWARPNRRRAALLDAMVGSADDFRRRNGMTNADAMTAVLPDRVYRLLSRKDRWRLWAAHSIVVRRSVDFHRRQP